MGTTQYRRSIIWVVIFAIWATETARFGTWALKTRSIYETLEFYKLPMGLLPKGVKNYSLGDDGKFEVYLEEPCTAKFESELHYDRNVSGVFEYGKIRNLTGVSAQELFLWFDVKGIRVDIPSSGVIYFDVGVVKKQFSLSLFENPQDCIASLESPGFRNPASGIAKKLKGILRYPFKQGKDAREVM